MTWFHYLLYNYNDIFFRRIEVHMPGDHTGLADFDGWKHCGGRVENITGRYIAVLKKKNQRFFKYGEMKLPKIVFGST